MAYDFLEDFEGIDEQEIEVYDVGYIVSHGAGSSIKIDTSQHFSLLASARIYSADLGVYNQFYKTKPVSRASGYSYASLRMDNDAQGINQSIRLSQAGSWGVILNLLRAGDIFASSKAIAYYDGITLTDSGLRWAKDTWYTFKIVFDCATDKFSCYVNGGGFSWSAVCTNKNFYGVLASIDRVTFMSGVRIDAITYNTWYDGEVFGPNDEGYPYPILSAHHGHWRY